MNGKFSIINIKITVIPHFIYIYIYIYVMKIFMYYIERLKILE